MPTHFNEHPTQKHMRVREVLVHNLEKNTSAKAVTIMITVVTIQEVQNVRSLLQCHRRMKRLKSTLNGNASAGTTAAHIRPRVPNMQTGANFLWPSH